MADESVKYTELVIFPYANKHSIPVIRFIAAWKVWFEKHLPEKDWRCTAMPRLNAKDGLHEQIRAGRRFSLDVLSRLLVPPPYRNTMQAENIFMDINKHIIEKVENVFNCQTNRLVKGARLTEYALQIWERTPEAEHDRQEEIVLSLLSSDIEVGVVPEILAVNNEFAEDQNQSYESQVPQDFRVLNQDAMKNVIEKLVRWIHTDPFQPYYRKKPVGKEVVGWDKRLFAYFWPNPSVGYSETEKRTVHFKKGFRALANKIVAGEPWESSDNERAIELAQKVFKWGGVIQDNVTADRIRQVMTNALFFREVYPKAPMNSGWTKIAAFATACMEGKQGQHPQVIWDSRVSTAIIHRLDRMFLESSLNAGLLFPNIGIVIGQGGTRPRNLKYKWPSGYQSWKTQYAASALVAHIRDTLNNSNNNFPPMPIPEGTTSNWTVRGVEMVLFGDGY